MGHESGIPRILLGPVYARLLYLPLSWSTCSVRGSSLCIGHVSNVVPKTFESSSQVNQREMGLERATIYRRLSDSTIRLRAGRNAGRLRACAAGAGHSLGQSWYNQTPVQEQWRGDSALEPPSILHLHYGNEGVCGGAQGDKSKAIGAQTNTGNILQSKIGVFKVIASILRHVYVPWARFCVGKVLQQFVVH